MGHIWRVKIELSFRRERSFYIWQGLYTRLMYRPIWHPFCDLNRPLLSPNGSEVPSWYSPRGLACPTIGGSPGYDFHQRFLAICDSRCRRQASHSKRGLVTRYIHNGRRLDLSSEPRLPFLPQWPSDLPIRPFFQLRYSKLTHQGV